MIGLDANIRPLVIAKFGTYSQYPTLFASDGDMHNAHNFHFYSNGFKDGVLHQQSLYTQVGRTSSRDVEALQTSIATKDVRLLLQEQDLKRYRSMIIRRNVGLQLLDEYLKNLREQQTPEKINLKFAIDNATRFTELFFTQFSREVL